MKNNFRVISMCSLMAAFAASSWAASNCPTGDGWSEVNGVCYYDMPKTTPADPLVIPADLKSFKLRYQGSDGSFTSKLNIHCNSNLNTVSVKGSAELAGGTLDILNRVNLDHFDIPEEAFAMLSFFDMTTEDLQPKTPMVTCSNNSCNILKTTGLNALSVVFTSTGTGNTNSFELTVTQEQYDFGPMQVLNVQGIDRTGMLATGAAMAGVDVSKIPAEAKNGLLLRGADENAMMSVPADIDVDYVYLDRTFTANGKEAASTIALPFGIATDNIEGALEILKFSRVADNTLYMKVVYCSTDNDAGYCPAKNGKDNGSLEAYKPYLVRLNSGASTLEFSGATTLVKTPAKTEFDASNGDWAFRGMFEKKTWNENDPELTGCNGGCAYGYAAEGENLGKFVRVGEGASIVPFRAYLVNTSASMLAPANASYVLRPTVNTPDELDIAVEGDNNQTTVIGKFNTRTGEMRMNSMKHTYDLKGRRVNGTNNARGAYYGKKVLMK